MKRDPSLTPLPAWKQRRARMVAWWRKSRDRRLKAHKTFKALASRAITLAISAAGAILVSYGAWSIYAPAGYLLGGMLVWAIQWNYGEGKE